jgi:hypothetical protein
MGIGSVSRHKKTRILIEAAAEILAPHHPMTVRQVFYQLVSGRVIEKPAEPTKLFQRPWFAARQESSIPWDKIEDRTRKPRHVLMWAGLGEFASEAAAAYRRDVWARQPTPVETWLEKDALSGIFASSASGRVESGLTSVPAGRRGTCVFAARSPEALMP